MERKAYPTDVSDAEWAFVAPYLTLMSEEAPQREYSLREVFNALRWMARAGGAWRLMPSGFAVAYGGKPSKERCLTTRLAAMGSGVSTNKSVG